MAIYYHVVIDKTNQGLAHLRNQLDLHGLMTAEQRGLTHQFPPVMIAMQHHQHVFLWDDRPAGVRGRQGLENGVGETITVKVNWPELTEPGLVFAGTLAGDSGHVGPPHGTSTNGAWAYKGSIARQWLFIDGVDSPNDPGFNDWVAGKGWP